MTGLEETEFSSKNFDKMNQSQAQTIKNIRELQRMEKNLYRKYPYRYWRLFNC